MRQNVVKEVSGQLVNSRYSRNISLIGQDGQDVLLDSKVLVVGAGGLGSSLLYYLVANGIGTVGIVDFDLVSLSDLQRQILYNTEMINGAKVDHAKVVLNKLNPDCNIITYKCSIQDKIDIIDDFDLVVECSDNFETKLLLNHQCYVKKKSLVLGAVIGFMGYAGTFKPYLGKEYPCYQCFCHEIPDQQESLQSCATQGVLNSVVGTIGSIQATMVMQDLLQIGMEKADKLIRVNALHNSFNVNTIMVDDQCPVCGT